MDFRRSVAHPAAACTTPGSAMDRYKIRMTAAIIIMYHVCSTFDDELKHVRVTALQRQLESERAYRSIGGYKMVCIFCIVYSFCSLYLQF